MHEQTPVFQHHPNILWMSNVVDVKFFKKKAKTRLLFQDNCGNNIKKGDNV